MDQLGKVPNPARGHGQLNRVNTIFSLFLSVRSLEFGLPTQVRPSRPASARSPSTLSLNMVRVRGIPPAFRGYVHLFIPSYAIGSAPSLSGHAKWRTDGGVHCRESTGTGPAVVLKVVPVTGAAAFSGFTMDQLLCATLFPHPLELYYIIDM